MLTDVPRSKKVMVRLTPAEYEWLRVRAHADQRTVSNFIYLLIMAARLTDQGPQPNDQLNGAVDVQST